MEQCCDHVEEEVVRFYFVPAAEAVLLDRQRPLVPASGAR